MKSQDSKSLWTTQPEKPVHYSYLKEFRVEQCPLFLQHKCTQHRPYTCFHWHFYNQRRRRPIRKRDGSFNYSPDNYCTKFDENTGICPDGDECPYLHRTAGDTERRYHLRYYKTGMCVHDTDVRGLCVKNGAHCAFAHGLEDVRPPVYDLRELHQSLEGGALTVEGMQQLLQESVAAVAVNGAAPAPPNGGVMPNSLDKERNMVTDDPRWQDTAFVLANYKTEQCKRPPRLCRQGYACPQYHNSRDRRRPPKKYKYRSTACPNVKHSDEWGEPSNCESGDACQYCHTRTEQQFHPEIYKSSKCNDIQQTGHCPRTVFCAFAHVDQEMTAVRETAANDNCSGTSLADILQSALPPDNPPASHVPQHMPTAMENAKNAASMAVSLSDARLTSNGFISPPNASSLAPIGSKCRQFSGGNGSPAASSGLMMSKEHHHPGMFSGVLGGGAMPGNCSAGYLKAPGSERETETNLKKQLAAKECGDRSLDIVDKLKRNSSNNGNGSNSLFIGGSGASSSGLNNGVLNSSFACSLASGCVVVGGSAMSIASKVSPLAPPFYPTNNTVESVVGNALDEINLSELSAAIDPEYNSISSSLNTGLASSGLIGCSAPVTIPGSSGGGGGSGSYHERSSLLSGLGPHNHHSSSPSTAAGAAFSAHHTFMPHNTGNPGSLEQNNFTSSFLRAANGPSNGGSVQERQQQHATPAKASSNHLFEPGTTISTSIFNNFPTNSMSLANSLTSNNLSSNLVSNLSNNLSSNLSNMSPHQNSVLSQSPLLFHSNTGGNSSNSEVWRMRDELISSHTKLVQWKDTVAQAQTACQAWSREVEETNRKIKLAEQAKEELLAKLKLAQQELEACHSSGGGTASPHVQVLHSHAELDALPRHVLQQLSNKLRVDQEAVEKALNNCTLPGEWSNVSSW